MEGEFLHWCEDGHHWREWPDGRVGPSWGFGLTKIAYEGWLSDRCPEPERGHTIYEGHGPYHGYKCPTCGTVHYVGGCGMMIGGKPPEWDKPSKPCEPPPPVCGKPPVRTEIWVQGNHRLNIASAWITVAVGESQLFLLHPEVLVELEAA